MRRWNSPWTNNSRASSRSKCSATEPASEFSIGITAALAEACSTRSKTSAERAHGTTVARGSILPAASWLKEPSSPWMAIFMDGQRIADAQMRVPRSSRPLAGAGSDYIPHRRHPERSVRAFTSPPRFLRRADAESKDRYSTHGRCPGSEQLARDGNPQVSKTARPGAPGFTMCFKGLLVRVGLQGCLNPHKYAGSCEVKHRYSHTTNAAAVGFQSVVARGTNSEVTECFGPCL